MKTVSVILLFLTLFLTACSSDSNILTKETSKFKDKKIESPFFGNKSSKVQMMIFTDFQCPACIRLEKTIWDDLFNKYIVTNKIGLTYKMYPLNIHKNAPEDALASLCAESQWKFKDFAKEMYSLEDTKKWLIVSSEEREKIAEKIWLDVQKFHQCMNEWNYVSKIKEDMALWDKLWLQWTPSIYINNQSVTFNSPEDIFKIIDWISKLDK